MINTYKSKKISLLTISMLAGSLFFTSCSVLKNKNTISSKTIERTFEAAKGNGILFGHQDDLAYGMGWSYVDGESDVKRVSGDYPAVFGWELGGIELGHTSNLDSVPFQTMKTLSVKAYEMGGINTYSWHPYSPVDGISAWSKEADVVKHIIPGGKNHADLVKQLDIVAAFFKSMKTVNGQPIPFIFRPWHEMDGDWFWWGSKQSTPDDYKTLFKFTVDYLRKEKGISNMLIAYSPDNRFNTIEEYYVRYPGDKYVDIMGMDNYGDLKTENGELAAIRKLHIVIAAAKEKNKFAALTETGLENVTDSTWFTQKLGVVLQDSLIAKELSYAMLWRSDEKVHFYFTYPGHSAEKDAKEFLNRPEILLLGDINKLTTK